MNLLVLFLVKQDLIAFHDQQLNHDVFEIDQLLPKFEINKKKIQLFSLIL